MSGEGLRIAQLANFVGPVSGGMRQAIDQLGRGYVAAGAERILVIPGRRDEVEATEAGVVVRVAAPRISRDYRMIAAWWRALDAVAAFEPTSIEVSDKWTLSPAGRWAARRGVGSILFSHERLDDMLEGWMRRQWGVSEFTGALNRRLSKEFDMIVYTSDYAGGEFHHLGTRLEKVPLGVDLATFTRSAGSPPTGGRPQLCYVGRMSREKSPQLGVGAVAELHRRGLEVDLHMYGTGPDIDWLRELAGDASVHFHGYVDGRAEVARCYAGSHMSLSVCPSETFGLAVLEALACGTPVVTSNRGGAHELVTPECGEFDEPRPANIADAIQRLLGRLSTDQEATRRAARERAEQYRWADSSARMLQLHRSIARSGPFPAGARGRWRQLKESL